MTEVVNRSALRRLPQESAATKFARLSALADETVMSYAPVTDDEEFRWMELAASIRNVVAFLEAQWELRRESITLHGPTTHDDPSEPAGDLSKSRRSRSPTKEPSDGLKNELLPTALVLWEGGEKPPAANSALGVAELEIDRSDPTVVIQRRPSAIA